MQSPLKVGVIGIGAMGFAMAANLRGKGYAVRARDIAASATEAAAAAGIDACKSPRELAEWADLLIVVVVNAKQIDDVLSGVDGVAQRSGERAAPVVMLCSTISPIDSAQFGQRLAELGIPALDAPISGGPVRAANGTMTIMVAGDKRIVARLDGVLNDLASKVFFISETIGDAAKTKLVNNMLAGINLTAGAEALALGHRLGLDRQQLFDVICASSGASWIFEDRMARALRDDYAPRAQAHILTKDVGLAVDMADGADIDTPLGDAALRIFEATIAAGLADEDDASVIKTMDPDFNKKTMRDIA
ncbi:NAD(P)-dependent oxidoreductase [soil metagenome]